jgi:hypothetical protein
MDLKILTLDVVVNSGVTQVELVNYDTLGLFKKKTTANGLVSRCEYYVEFDGETYSNKLVDVTFSYTFNGVVYIGSTTRVQWINLDEEVGYEKTFVKTFMPWEIIDFGVIKRTNILSTAKLYALGQIGIVNGYDLMNACAIEVEQYISGPYQPLVDKILSLVGVKAYLTLELATNINQILTDL